MQILQSQKMVGKILNPHWNRALIMAKNLLTGSVHFVVERMATATKRLTFCHGMEMSTGFSLARDSPVLT